MSLIKKLIVAGLLLMLSAPSVFADGGFIPPISTDDIVEPHQKAVLYCHGDMEKMLLNVRYSGEVTDFAWLVPLPDVPEVTEGNFEVFEELNEMYGSWGYRGVAEGGGALEAKDMAPPPVVVIERKKVSVYDVSILEATDASALADWLNNNGYHYPEDKASIFQHYISRGWIFVAMRISPDEQNAEVIGKLKSGEINPLDFEFETENCVYPLHISKANGNTTNIILYVLGDTYYHTSMLSTLMADVMAIPVLEWNPALAEFLGYSNREIENSDWEDSIHVTKLRRILDPGQMNQDVILNQIDYPNDYYYGDDLENYGVVDVYPESDFFAYVEYLVRNNIDKGFEEGNGEYTFRMVDNITRGDFTKFIVKTYGFAIDTSESDFPDVKSSDPNYIYIKTARNLGLLSGYPDGNFYPDKKITRGEGMKILARALDQKGVIDLDEIEQLTGSAQFNDVLKSHEFYHYILAAVKLGIIDGYGNGNFGPNDHITRGQSSKVVMEGKMLLK